LEIYFILVSKLPSYLVLQNYVKTALQGSKDPKLEEGRNKRRMWQRSIKSQVAKKVNKEKCLSALAKEIGGNSIKISSDRFHSKPKKVFF